MTRVSFGAFEVDLAALQVRKHGMRVRLQEQPFRILAMLLRKPGEIVSRDDLRRELWPADTFVDFDHSLNNAMNRLRETLGDSAEAPRFIETLPRVGYRFVTPVEALAAPPPRTDAAPPTPAPPSPAPRQVRPRLAAGVVLAVAAALAAYAALRRLDTDRSAAPSGKVMLAVLPFQNLSGDPQQDYLSDGFTEEMIAQLGHVQPSRLGVIARTSAMHYKGAHKRVDQVGRELGVDYVLEGSVRRAGGRVRITAQLIEVREQIHLWSRSYEKALTDVLELQSEVARSIAEEIRIRLTPQDRERLASVRAVHPEAYPLYLKGRYHLNKRTEEGLRKGLEYFQQAIDLDPADALAYAGLADAYLLLGSGDYSVMPPREAMPRAKAAARKALEIDDGLAAAHATLAFIAYTYDWDWTGAERDFQRALDLDPNDATAHHWYSLYLKSMGRRPAALTEARRALELDPLSLIIGTDMAWSLFHLREYGPAVEQCRKILDLDPHFAVAHWNLGLAYVEMGEHVRAKAEFDEAARLAGRSPVYVAALGHAAAVSGHRDAALQRLAELEALSKQRYVSPADVAMVQIGLGERDAAFRLLEKAYQERSDFFVNFKVDPRLDPLRSDPRFGALLHRVGLDGPA